MSKPKLKIPPGTLVSIQFSQVTLVFSLESEAEAFVEWLRWIDQLENPEELVATPNKVIKQ